VIKLTESILKEKKNIRKSFELEIEIEKLEEKRRLQEVFLYQLDNETKKHKRQKESLEEMVQKSEATPAIRSALQPIYSKKPTSLLLKKN
jgi:hypothetical protein